MKRKGVQLGRLGASFAAIAGGLDANAATNAAGVAIEENVFCGGFCIGGGLAIISWILYEGEGDPLEGLRRIGAEETSLQRFIAELGGDVIRLSGEHFPKTTQSVLEALDELEEGAGILVFWVDDQTGNRVSYYWNQLDEDTQDILKGTATSITLVIPSTFAGKIVDKSPELGIADFTNATRHAATSQGAITQKSPAMLADPEHPDWGRYVDVNSKKETSNTDLYAENLKVTKSGSGVGGS